MFFKEYVVLKSKLPRPRTLESVGPVPMSIPSMSAADLEVQQAQLSSADRDMIRADRNTLAIAPVMPMKLIEPVSTQAIQSAAPGSTWGVSATGADRSAFDGSGIKVAVIDTGIDPQHPAFAGVNLSRRNFTSESDDDTHGHGTHCAGTIFGRDVDGQRIGIAPGVTDAIIAKALGAGGGSSASIAEAIQWCVNEGAHVVSMSLGIDFPGVVNELINVNGLDPEPATSIALEAYRANVNMFSGLASFIQASGSFNQGTIIVAASGNESRRPQYEIAVAPPAAGNGILSVGALQQSGAGLTVANFSNNQCDITAPGVNIISAAAGGGLVSMNGTSMATPHVAGVSALWAQQLLQQSGRVDGSVLTARVIASGDLQQLAPGFDNEDIGQGLVQAPL